MIVEVIPEKRTSPGKDTFSYLVPETLRNQIKVGSIVEIPFGKKTIQGIVLEIQLTDNRLQQKQKYELKEIFSVNTDFVIPLQYLHVAKWVSLYYLCSLGEAISLFMPPKFSQTRKMESRIKNQELCKIAVLNSEQKTVFNDLKAKLLNPQKPALLHGVTGSGKTEIYIKLVNEVLKSKKQTIILTPEIMLTPQILAKFEECFPEQIALMHSGLTQSEKWKSYSGFYNGEKSILVGPRSALLVPSQNLGLIIIDEEQEDAYKQEKDPRYHAVDLAEQLAKENGALLLLGSATPIIETYYKAVCTLCHPERPEGVEGSCDETDSSVAPQNDTCLDLVELKSRYQKLILPTAEVIDLKYEIKYDNFSPISVKLQEKIKQVLDNKRQIILFLNRRGMATFVSCRECGEVILCPNCSIPMVYHVYDKRNILDCHHCDFKTKVPEVCPKCGSQKIKFFGAGVDKIVQEVENLFPKARIKKVDSKSLANKNDYTRLHDDIKNHKIDILIGTQILAKGLDIPAVDLVGVISADTGLHLPYYKANEKVFSLITQVSGRSGRKDNVGQTVIQTYWPDSGAILLAAQHDYHTFYESEIIEREKFDYPPFCRLVRVVSEDKSESKAKKDVENIAGELKKREISFIGPAKCFLSRINNKYRYHLIIKTKTLPNPKITDVFETNPYLIWDTDPVDLL